MFGDEQTLLSCFCNDGSIQHFSRHSFPCCSHTRHSMNVSNNNSQLPTTKSWRMATLKQKRTSPFSQVQSKGFAGEGPGGVLFFFVTLRASRDETAASPQGLDSSHGDKGSLLGVSRLTASSKFYTPPFNLSLITLSQSHAQRALRLPEALRRKVAESTPRWHMKSKSDTPEKFWTLTSRRKLRCFPYQPGMPLPAWATKWAQHLLTEFLFRTHNAKKDNPIKKAVGRRKTWPHSFKYRGFPGVKCLRMALLTLSQTRKV